MLCGGGSPHHTLLRLPTKYLHMTSKRGLWEESTSWLLFSNFIIHRERRREISLFNFFFVISMLIYYTEDVNKKKAPTLQKNIWFFLAFYFILSFLSIIVKKSKQGQLINHAIHSSWMTCFLFVLRAQIIIRKVFCIRALTFPA